MSSNVLDAEIQCKIMPDSFPQGAYNRVNVDERKAGMPYISLYSQHITCTDTDRMLKTRYFTGHSSTHLLET